MRKEAFVIKEALLSQREVTKTKQNKMPTWKHSLTFLLIFAITNVSLGGEDELEALMEKMASDALELAAEIERVYAERCSVNTLSQCANANYDSCLSEYPQQTCPGGEVFTISACGDGVSCGGLFDFTVSSVELPDTINNGVDGNPTDNEVKETICYTLQAEPYMIQKFKDETNFWAQFGVESPQMYFGSVNGAYRIYPARNAKECGLYDARKRPWYIAATSGPKDVILLLDTSGSMTRYRRLELMKKAASKVIETLTVADHVAVVAFNTEAKYLDQPTMMKATKENKQKLLNAVDELRAEKQTNYMEAFDKAFDILKLSQDNEISSNCHTAILFLTDGKMTVPDGVTVNDVIQQIAIRKQEIKTDPFIFLYGLGREANDGDADVDLQKIACSTRGMWSQVKDGEDLTTAMVNYYKLFALGLGNDENEGFTAWVEPYSFFTAKVMGTSVSAPVYDRSVWPPILLGAVSTDFTMEAMNKALGVEAGSKETLERLVQRSIAVCPKLNLTDCEIQSLRIAAGGEKALCPDECSDFVGIIPDTCESVSYHPTYFWKNTKNIGRTYRERACCEVGETRLAGQYTLEELQSQQCIMANATQSSREKDSATNKLVGIVIGAVGAVVAVGLVSFGVHRMRKNVDSSSTSKNVDKDIESVKKEESFKKEKFETNEGFVEKKGSITEQKFAGKDESETKQPYIDGYENIGITGLTPVPPPPFNPSYSSRLNPLPDAPSYDSSD